MPIDAFLLGGRRPYTIPLVTQAFDWNHGVFMGSMIGSEVTAAALDVKAGMVRRDPFAMLPFCGYHMGDYFAHWIHMGEKTPLAAQPKFFLVNWFRKTKEGKWLWPGYGENSRVLKWVFERCDGQGKAVESPIGFLPAADAIDRPKGVTAEDMQELLAVDLPGWRAELADVRTNHYPKFEEKLPRELKDQLEALSQRLK